MSEVGIERAALRQKDPSSSSRGRRRGVSEEVGDGEVVVEEAGGDGIETGFVQAGGDGTGAALPLLQQWGLPA